jgi:predicted DsbA family dithiol-disulfide isomerase
LHPETPAAGITLEELFAGRNVDLEASQARMRGLMAQEGLPYGQRTRTYNSRLAQELGKWADTQPDGERLHDALFRAYFVDNKNIGDIDTLVDIASSSGLSATAARQVLETRQFQAAVDADWQRSRAFGITGVPTFVANGRGVVGAQPYEVLERLVLVAGGVPRQG